MRNVQSRPAQGRRTPLLRAVLVAGLIAAPLSLVYAQDPATQPPAGQAPAGQATAGQAPAAQPTPPGITFDSDAGILIMYIKPDKTADFEAAMAKLHNALVNSDRPERKQQAAGWKLYKASDPGPNGTVLYVNFLAPTLKGADYTISKILAEVFPQEVQQLFPLYRDAFAGLARAELSLIQDFSTAAK